MSKDNHGFSVSVACKVGVPGAIVLQHLCFLQKNLIAPNENWQEKWVKRSAQAMTVAYPYWSAKQIRTILDNLESDGYSLSKIENENRYDRSKSYILTKSGAELLGEKWEIAFSEKENESDQMEKEDLPNGQMIIKEGCNSFVPSFVEEKAASIFPSPETENQPLEAKKKENGLQTGAGGAAELPLVPPFTPVGTIEPQPAKIIRMKDPDLPPKTTICDSVPGTYSPPSEFKRVNISEEIERLKTDQLAQETFSLVRKIPSNLFAEYVEAFEKEIKGTGESHHNQPAFRKHFFNWSGTRYEIAQRKAKPAQETAYTSPKNAVY